MLRSRRHFMAGATIAVGLPALSGCARGADPAYTRIAAELRAPLPASAALADLVRYATLAPNGHNTQPWRFLARVGGISVVPDFSRRTPIVDPDDHHLWVSLGCAVENLLIAAAARGQAGALAMREGAGGVAMTACAQRSRGDNRPGRPTKARQSQPPRWQRCKLQPVTRAWTFDCSRQHPIANAS